MTTITAGVTAAAAAAAAPLSWIDLLVDDVLRGPIADNLVSLEDLALDTKHNQLSPALEAAREGLFDLLALRSTDKKRYEVLKDAPRPTRVEWMCRLLRRGEHAAFLAQHFSTKVFAELFPSTPVYWSSLSPLKRLQIIETPTAYFSSAQYYMIENVYNGHYTSLSLAAGRHGAPEYLEILEFFNSIATNRYPCNGSQEHYYAFFTGIYRQAYPLRPPCRNILIGCVSTSSAYMALVDAAREHGDFDIVSDMRDHSGVVVPLTANRFCPLVPFTPQELRIVREHESLDAFLAHFMQTQDIGVLFPLATAPISDAVVPHVSTALGLLAPYANAGAISLWTIWIATWILASACPRYLALFTAVFATSPGGLSAILDRVKTMGAGSMGVLFASHRRMPNVPYHMRAPLTATDVRDLIAFEREHPGVLASVHDDPRVYGYTLSVEKASVSDWPRDGDALCVLPLTVVAPIVVSLLDMAAFQTELPRILRPVMTLLGRAQRERLVKPTVIGELAYRIAAWNPAFFWEEAAALLSPTDIVLTGSHAQHASVFSALPPVRSSLTPLAFTIACFRYYYRRCPRHEMRDFREMRDDGGFDYSMTFRGQARIFAEIEALAARAFDSEHGV